MVAPFVSFTVAYSWSCKRLLRPTRFPTLLVAIMHCCLFQLMRLLIFSSNSSTSCIRPQRLYKLALRPFLLEHYRQSTVDTDRQFNHICTVLGTKVYLKTLTIYYLDNYIIIFDMLLYLSGD